MNKYHLKNYIYIHLDFRPHPMVIIYIIKNIIKYKDQPIPPNSCLEINKKDVLSGL